MPAEQKNSFWSKISRWALRYWHTIQVKLQDCFAQMSMDCLQLNDSKTIPSKYNLWTAGTS